jgi:hypothetical protein
MTSPVFALQQSTVGGIPTELSEEFLDEGDWAEFTEHLNAPQVHTGNESVLDVLDQSKASLQQSLDLVALQPNARNMFEATRRLSAFDLQTLVVGKVVDKATKGIDRMLNMQ